MTQAVKNKADVRAKTVNGFMSDNRQRGSMPQSAIDAPYRASPDQLVPVERYYVTPSGGIF